MNTEKLQQSIKTYKGHQDNAFEKLRVNPNAIMEELYDFNAFDAKWRLQTVTRQTVPFKTRRQCELPRHPQTVCRNHCVVLPPLPAEAGITLDDICAVFFELAIELNDTRVDRSNSMKDLELLNRFQNYKNPYAKVAPYLDDKGRPHIPFVIVTPNFVHQKGTGKWVNVYTDADPSYFIEYTKENEKILAVMEKYVSDLPDNPDYYVEYDMCKYEFQLPIVYTSALLQSSFTGIESMNLLLQSQLIKKGVRLNFNHPTYWIAVKMQKEYTNTFINFESTDDPLFKSLTYKLVIKGDVGSGGDVVLFEGSLVDLRKIKQQMGINMPETLIIPFMAQKKVANFSPFTEDTLNMSMICNTQLIISPFEGTTELLETYNADPDAAAYKVKVWITSLYNHIYSVHGDRGEQCKFRPGEYVFHFSK